MSTFTLALSFDHFRFALIHGRNIPGSYAILLFTASDFASCCFCVGSVSSFFLELSLHWSPVTYWAPTDLGSSSFSVLSFYLFILFMGFSRQEYWSGLPFPSPVDHILSDLSTMTRPSWVTPHSMAHSFIELEKAVVHVIRLVSFLLLWFSICPPSTLGSKSLILSSFTYYWVLTFTLERTFVSSDRLCCHLDSASVLIKLHTHSESQEPEGCHCEWHLFGPGSPDTFASPLWKIQKDNWRNKALEKLSTPKGSRNN